MPIYLDYAATTPVCPEAAQAAYEVLTGCFGNPSSGYAPGRQAAAALKGWRADVSSALGCTPAELFFTSCGTEGDNWALRASARAMHRRGNHIITTKVEHHAVLDTCEYLEKQGFEVTYLDVDEYGMVTADMVAAAIRPAALMRGPIPKAISWEPMILSPRELFSRRTRNPVLFR